MSEFRISDMMRSISKSKLTSMKESREAAQGKHQRQGDMPQAKITVNTFISTQRKGLTFREYGDLFLRYRWTVVICGLLVLAAVVLLEWRMERPYVSRGTIIYHAPGKGDLLAQDGIVYYTTTVLRMAESAPVHELTRKLLIERLKGLEGEEAKALLEALDSQPEEELIGELLQEAGTENEDIITVSATHVGSKLLCRVLVDAHMDALLMHLSQQVSLDYRRQLEEVRVSIEENRAELKNVDQELRLLLDPEEGLSLNDQQFSHTIKMERTYRSLSRQKSRLQEIEAEVKEHLAFLNLPPDFQGQIQWILPGDGMYQRFRNMEVELEAARRRYDDDSPLYLKIQREKQALEKTLFDESDGIPRRVATPERKVYFRTLQQLQVNQKKVESEVDVLSENWERTLENLVEGGEIQNQINKLSARSKFLDVHLEGLVAVERMIQLRLTSSKTGYQILESSQPAVREEPPSWMAVMVPGLLFGLGLGCGLSVLLYHFASSPINSTDLRRRYALPLFGVLPLWKEGEGLNDKGDDLMGEMYSIVKNNVRYSHDEFPEKAVLIVSPSQNDGKSLSAINLALSFAQEGQSVLLMSADLRSPRALTRMIPKDQEVVGGIVELLEHKVEFDDAVRPSLFENLSILPTWKKATNPTRLLSKDALTDIVRTAEFRYDAVIIDTPAALPVVDTTIFAHVARCLMLVVRAQKTSYDEVNTTLNRLDHVGAKVHGILLNGVKDMMTERFYGVAKRRRRHQR